VRGSLGGRGGKDKKDLARQTSRRQSVQEKEAPEMIGGFLIQELK
jgi:hypothetical protein